jgi:hypothetical protein
MNARFDHHARNEKEDKMSLLERLAEPAFAKDHVIRPSARILGAILVAFNILSCIRWFPELRSVFPDTFTDPITPVQILVGALLPQILMIAGGIWMMLGDARGKRLVVLSIPVGFVYVLAVAMQSYYPGFALIFGVPFFAAWLAFFYYLVVTSQVGPDPRVWRRVLSTAVMVLAVGFLVVYASIVFETLTSYATSYAMHQGSLHALFLAA